MAISLKNPPATETTSGGAKKYLDYAGLNALWDNICDKFAPQWKSVNFDHIAKSSPTQTDDSVVLTFQNLSMPPVTEGEFAGVVDHTHVNQTTWTIAAAQASENGEGGQAGVMTAADKAKLDALDNTLGSVVNTAIKINEIRIGNTKADATKLTVKASDDDKTKAVAFGLDYNVETDLLSIVDLNNNKTALSSVTILGDALKDAAFNWETADVIKKADGNTYLYFQVVLTPQQGVSYTKELEININDLVSLYEAGNGIKLTISNDGIGTDDATSTKIEVIAPTRDSDVNKIGGIIPDNIYTDSSVTNWKNTAGTTAPAIQDLGTKSGRYFGIETDKDGHAFVNVPVADLIIVEEIPQTAQSISNNDGDTEFTVVSGFEPTLSDDGKTWTLAPKTTKYTLTREEEITVTPATPTGDPSEINADGGVITYIDGVSVEANTHKLSYQQKQVKIKETPLVLTHVDGDDINVELTPGVTSVIDVDVVTSVNEYEPNGHTVEVTKQSIKFSVGDPAAIDIGYIEGLTWSIPVRRTDSQYRNESDYENSESHQSGDLKVE